MRTPEFFRSLCFVYILQAVLCQPAKTQTVHSDSLVMPSVKSLSVKPDAKRLQKVWIVQGSIWAGSLIALNQAWYAQYPRSGFHTFNDRAEWLQVDKVGHAWSAYWGTQLSTAMFRWAGVSKKRSALYGGGMGIAYLSVIEILDGFSKKWGFSMADMGANLSGSLLYATQEWGWGEQRIELRFSSHINRYTDPVLRQRANQLYGSSWPERILKDYNAQTYWLSANLKSLTGSKKMPAWFNIAVGYGATGMFGGHDNVQRNDLNEIVLNSQGLPVFDGRHIPRLRQFYLSPDIDLSRIRIHGRNPRLLRLLSTLRLKIPLPTLELNSQGTLRFHPLFF